MMNANHGNMMMYECNLSSVLLSQNPPPPINYPQDQAFQYMNNNQNPTFPTFSSNSMPFIPFHTLQNALYQPQDQEFQYMNNNQNPTFPTFPNNSFQFIPFRTLESTPYQPQETLGQLPISFMTPPSFPISNSTLVPNSSSVVVQVIREIESGSDSFKNNVKELYIGQYDSPTNDPYYSMRKKLISPFSPYLGVTGCWPNEQLQDDGVEVSNTGNKRQSKKKNNLCSCITWNSIFTSGIPNPQPPIKMTKNMKFLFMKELRVSDVNNLKRIILPKNEAESHFPMLVEKTGIEMLMRDVLLSVTWRMKFHFWNNNGSRIYVLDHAGDFVKKYELKCGDAIAFYRDDTNQIYIYAKKKETSDSSLRQVSTPPTHEEINMTFPNEVGNLGNNTPNPGEPSSAPQGLTNFNDLQSYYNQIAAVLFNEDDETSSDYSNNINAYEPSPSLSQEGQFSSFDAVGESMFNEHYNISSNRVIGGVETSLAKEELMNLNGVSRFLNELFDKSPAFDEHGLSCIDLRPGNQDDCVILK